MTARKKKTGTRPVSVSLFKRYHTRCGTPAAIMTAMLPRMTAAEIHTLMQTRQ